MRFLALDGWRGLAALLVALYHLAFYNHLYNLTFLRNSYLFVDFFFVLSGFVISHAYQNRLNNLQEAKGFIVLRIARLWPLHIFVLLLFIILELAKLLILNNSSGWSIDNTPFTNEYSISSIFSNIFLLQSINAHDQLTWNYPSWSISVEFYTYLVFTAFILITKYFKRLTTPLYLILISASMLILFFDINNLNDATYHNGIFRCILGFFLGSLCYKTFLLTKNIKLLFPTLMEIAIVAGLIFFILEFGNNKYSLLSSYLFVVAVYIFAFEQGAISKLLKRKPFQNLGKWSYSIYMLHALILLLVGRLFNVLEKVMNIQITETNTNNEVSQELFYLLSPYFMDLLTALYLLILIFIASLSYKHIEKKGSLLIKRALTSPIYKKENTLGMKG